MEFLGIILCILFITSKIEAVNRAKATDYLVNQNCTEVFSVTIPRYVPYEERYRTKNWLGFYKWKTRTNYRIENQVSSQRRTVCCHGYSSVSSLYGSSMCLPLCSRDCGWHGVCSQPDTCTCFDGYSVSNLTPVCSPVCSNKCINGLCAAPNLCLCNGGFRMTSDGFTCEPICDNCSNRTEICIRPHVCQCAHGYSRSPLDRLDQLDVGKCVPVCDTPCVNGNCVEPNVCACKPGYDNPTGDLFKCEPKCSRGCKDGQCVAPEKCVCTQGYQFSNGSDHICEPICNDQCVNADCIAPNLCSCKEGYVPEKDEWSHVCKPYCTTDCANGRCSEPYKCSCDPGYVASEDEQYCEPVCTRPCYFGNCTAPEICTCYPGYELSKINVNMCEPVCSRGYALSSDRQTCEPLCDSSCDHGMCSEPNKCSCEPGYTVSADWQTCEPFCSEACVMGNCTAPDVCTCFEGYKLADYSNSTCEPVCSRECIRGYCSDPEICTCHDGHEKKNSTDGHDNTCVVICECENGFCDDDNSTCKSCAEGYELTTHDPYENFTMLCERRCESNCSHGSCNRTTGLCDCSFGWDGRRCDEAIFCSVKLTFPDIEDIGEWTEKEDPWTGPICHEQCLNEIDNDTKCLNRSDTEDNLDMTCFLSIDDPCNAVMANLYRVSMSTTTIVIGSVIAVLVLLLATIVAATIIIRKRKRRDAIELTSGGQEHPEDCLIQNQGDGISL